MRENTGKGLWRKPSQIHSYPHSLPIISWVKDWKLTWALSSLPCGLSPSPSSLLSPASHFSVFQSDWPIFCLPQESFPPLPFLLSGLSPQWEWPLPSLPWSHIIALCIFLNSPTIQDLLFLFLFFSLQNIQ